MNSARAPSDKRPLPCCSSMFVALLHSHVLSLQPRLHYFALHMHVRKTAPQCSLSPSRAGTKCSHHKLLATTLKLELPAHRPLDTCRTWPRKRHGEGMCVGACQLAASTRTKVASKRAAAAGSNATTRDARNNLIVIRMRPRLL